MNILNTVHLRQARLEDLPALLRFEQSLITAERPFDKTLKPGTIHYYDLAQLIESPDAEVLVAAAGERLVGSGYARILHAKDYYRFTQYAYLGFMYVEPEFRGQGINQRIILALKDWALARGLNEIRLQVYEENIAAVKAYEKVGFTKGLVEMRMDL